MKLEITISLNPENSLPCPAPAVYEIKLPGSPDDQSDIEKLVNAAVGMINFEEIVPKLAERCTIVKQVDSEGSGETEGDESNDTDPVFRES